MTFPWQVQVYQFGPRHQSKYLYRIKLGHGATVCLDPAHVLTFKDTWRVLVDTLLCGLGICQVDSPYPIMVLQKVYKRTQKSIPLSLVVALNPKP